MICFHKNERAPARHTLLTRLHSLPADKNRGVSPHGGRCAPSRVLLTPLIRGEALIRTSTLPLLACAFTPSRGPARGWRCLASLPLGSVCTSTSAAGLRIYTRQGPRGSNRGARDRTLRVWPPCRINAPAGNPPDPPQGPRGSRWTTSKEAPGTASSRTASLTLMACTPMAPPGTGEGGRPETPNIGKSGASGRAERSDRCTRLEFVDTPCNATQRMALCVWQVQSVQDARACQRRPMVVFACLSGRVEVGHMSSCPCTTSDPLSREPLSPPHTSHVMPNRALPALHAPHHPP